MTVFAETCLWGLIGGVAFLYSSVGHAGASGYLAVFSLVGWAPAQTRPLVLLLNVLVATVTSLKFYRSGHFRPALFIPLTLLSIPASMLGGYVRIPTPLLSVFLGAVLLFSALWLLTGKREPAECSPPGKSAFLLAGGAIGFLAGASGTGGGIFLSPLMIYLRWAKLAEISAIAAPYVLVNSVAGLVGLNLSGFSLPAGWLPYVLAAVVGGAAGSSFGIRLLNGRTIQILLAAVLSIAAGKLFLSFRG